MSKIIITCEFEMDFQKYFDEIPEGLYVDVEGEEDEGIDIDDIKSYVYSVFQDSYCHQLEKHMDWMANDKQDLYKYAKHHLKIGEDVAEKIKDNVKVTVIFNENK